VSFVNSSKTVVAYFSGMIVYTFSVVLAFSWTPAANTGARSNPIMLNTIKAFFMLFIEILLR